MTKSNAAMKAEYERLIANHDQTLAMLRQNWMEATPDHKEDWMHRINGALDERLRLMGIRDNLPA